MKITLLIIILFLIGFISDIFLQIFSTKSLFKPFWKRYGSFVGAIIAGILTLIIGLMVIPISFEIFKFLKLSTTTWTFVLFSTALAFVMGVIIDVYTNRGDWLGPTLRLWYDTQGEDKAALWSGGLTFSFVVFIATVLMKK